MTYDYPQTHFSKSILAGVFAGIAATLLNLAYDFFFRDLTQFEPSQIVNVATIIFATMVLFTAAGLFYFIFSNYIKGGMLLFIVVFAVITILCCIWGLHIQRSPNQHVTEDFRKLFLGIVGISGCLITFFIPYLMKHQDIFI